MPTAATTVVVQTFLDLSDSNPNKSINLGVMKSAIRSYAYVSFANGMALTLFPVNASDQMDAEIYLDTTTNQWLIFIGDLTTGQFYSNEFSYTTSLTTAGWLVALNGSPVPPMNAIVFTNAQWESNWAGWQHITSSASSYYAQWTIELPGGYLILPTAIPDPPGTSFALLVCTTCA